MFPSSWFWIENQVNWMNWREKTGATLQRSGPCLLLSPLPLEAVVGWRTDVRTRELQGPNPPHPCSRARGWFSPDKLLECQTAHQLPNTSSHLADHLSPAHLHKNDSESPHGTLWHLWALEQNLYHLGHLIFSRWGYTNALDIIGNTVKVQ